MFTCAALCNFEEARSSHQNNRSKIKIQTASVYFVGESCRLLKWKCILQIVSIGSSIVKFVARCSLSLLSTNIRIYVSVVSWNQWNLNQKEVSKKIKAQWEKRLINQMTMGQFRRVVNLVLIAWTMGYKLLALGLWAREVDLLKDVMPSYSKTNNQL